MYAKLELNNINFNINKEQVNFKKIIKGLSYCYTNYAFSTFPYIIEELSSKEAIKKYHSGNCIALSMLLKKYLKKKFNINSFLIPVTIPKKYYKKGYLQISHVALLIPKSDDTFYIADPAFYFLNPIKTNKNNMIIYSKNIYTKELETKPELYKSLDKIICNTHKLQSDLILNEYQQIPNNTLYSQVFFDYDMTDSWNYYIIEIINPDKAISNFFINLSYKPFILTTKLDNNGICVMDTYIKFISNTILEITSNNIKNSYDLNNISKENFKKILLKCGDNINKFFNGNILDILYNYKNNTKNTFNISD